jgi:hypothetical protein
MNMLTCSWRIVMKDRRRNAVTLLFTILLLPVSVAWAAGDRTPAGHPDFSGSYDGATLTPLTRPAGLGDNLYLTKEEADKLAAEEAERMSEAASVSDPDRTAPPAGGDGSPGAAGNVGGYNAFWIDRGTDAFSVDGKFRTSVIVEPKNGQFPPKTPAGQARMGALFASFGRTNEGKAWWLDQEGPGPYDNMEQRDNAERCLLGFSGAAPSIPSLYNNFKRIVQTDTHVMILIEMVHDARVVRMNSEHPGPEVQKWLGDSIGWWEGDTLVIDTTNYSPKSAGFVGGSAQAHVVERLSQLDDGNLLYNFTMEDDSQWTAPWTGEYVWKASDQKVYEYACHEGNYALGNIMRGARLLEKDVIAGGGD